MATTFEHKLMKYDQKWKGFDYGAIERDLVDLGAEGWEVVSTIVPSMGSGHTTEIAVLLKRTRA
ncbi:MAG: DUF4177 domain-containing protein [Pseudonocardia sediminis]